MVIIITLVFLEMGFASKRSQNEANNLYRLTGRGYFIVSQVRPSWPARTARQNARRAGTVRSGGASFLKIPTSSVWSVGRVGN